MRVLYMNPFVLGAIGPGFPNEVPTFAGTQCPTLIPNTLNAEP